MKNNTSTLLSKSTVYKMFDQICENVEAWGYIKTKIPSLQIEEFNRFCDIQMYEIQSDN
jgi:hypothetical protein